MDITLEHGTSSAKFDFWQVEPENAYAYLEQIVKLLRPQKLRGPVLYGFTDMINMIEHGRMQLWLAKKPGDDGPCLFMLTEFILYPNGTVCNLCLLGGRHLAAVARQHFPTFVNWCVAHNVQFIEACTSTGIAHILSKLGFTKTGIRVHYSIQRYN